MLGFDAPSLAAVSLASLLTSGGHSHAPPLRMAHPGASGRVDEGSTDIAFGVTDDSGARSVGRGLRDQFAIEGGFESNFTDLVIGFAGVRYTPIPPRDRKIAFVFDVEGGAGIGVGGEVCDEDGKCSNAAANLRRPAGGVYMGVGAGWKIHFVSPYLRARHQLTGARDAPMTAYTTMVGGVQFAIFDTLHLWCGTGFRHVLTAAGRTNLKSPRSAWLTYDFGISLTFGGPRRREALDRHGPRRARANR